MLLSQPPLFSLRPLEDLSGTKSGFELHDPGFQFKGLLLEL